MDLIETILLILLVLVAVSLGGLVLIQQSKGADIGAAFGSGAASTLFGSSGATSFLVKFTAMLAIGFFLVTFGLAYTAAERAANLQGIDFEQPPALVEEPRSTTPTSSGDEMPDDANPDVPLEGDDMPTFEQQDAPTDTSESGDDATPELPDI